MRICDLIENELAGSKWIEGLQSHSCYHRAHETLPHRLVWEVIRQLLSLSVYVSDHGENGLTSKLKSTPPTGAPKATDMPAAAAAERTSRLRATSVSDAIGERSGTRTLILIQGGKELEEQVRAAASHVDKRPFLTKPETLRSGQLAHVFYNALCT